MLLSLMLALLGTPAVAVDTVPVPRATVVERAFLDRDAEAILRLARERRDSTRLAIQAYQTIGRERISLGMRTLGRERIFFRSEHAARIHWRRHGTSRVEVLGSRQVTPLFTSGVKVPDGARSDGIGLAFDPADDAFFSDLFGNSGAMQTDGDAWFRHPLAPGSEADYQFRSGDTTRIRLPDGSDVHLLELQVIPRRSDSRLIHGSYWLDAATHAPVRAVFRLARAFDLQMDRRFMDEDAQEDLNEVPLAVRPLIFPIRADLRFLTVEYGLWEGRWWMPRLTAVDAIAEVGSLGSFPVRFERAYSDYRVMGPETNGSLAAAAADSVITQCPRPARRSAQGDTAGTAADTVEGRRIVIGISDRRDPDPSSPAADGGSDTRTTRHCRCNHGQCRFWDVEVPRDTERLINSDFLPPSIYTSGETMVNGEQFSQLVDRLSSLAPTPWAIARPSFGWSVADGDLVRFNRVEGLSVGARGVAEFGALSVDATARLGIADLEPRGELGIDREGLAHQVRMAGYHRLTPVDPLQRPFGLGNSLSALLLGRDDGDYFGATGVEVTGGPARTLFPSYGWRLFAEQQRDVIKETDFSLLHLVNRDRVFRPNLTTQDANQFGGSAQLRLQRGLNPTGVRWGGDLFVEAATGTFRYARPAVGASLVAPLPGRFLGAVDVAAGTSFGELPTQSAWQIGGSGTVRGYDPRSAVGTAFWRARAEISNALPGARWVLFSDAGWAGAREEVQLDPLLLSAGAGLSFLDGLIRLDLARTLRGERQWRAELYLNGTL